MVTTGPHESTGALLAGTLPLPKDALQYLPKRHHTLRLG